VTLILPNSVFLHVPKAGGTWVRAALKKTGLIQDELISKYSDESTEGKMRSWHCVPRDKSIFKDKYVFCFVRHPLTWYQSHWAYKVRNGNWNSGNKLDALCESHSFNDFIVNVAREFPNGYLHWLYKFYAQHASFVGKMENLESDLISALFMAGEDFKADDIINTPKRNVMPDKYKRRAKYETANAIRVMQIEQDAIREYGYDFRMPVLRVN
jgi:hypothetical protein